MKKFHRNDDNEKQRKSITLLLLVLLFSRVNGPVLRSNGDCSLSNREEAPDCRFLTGITWEEGGDEWSSQEEDDSTPVESHEHWSDEHVEEVDRDRWEWIAWLDHLECPLNVVGAICRAGFWTTNTFYVMGTLLEEEILAILFVPKGWDDDPEAHQNTNNSTELDDEHPGAITLLLDVLLIEGGESEIGEEWLEGDVNPSKSSEPDIDWVCALVDDKILYKLQEFHKGKPEEARRKTILPPILSSPDSLTTENPASNSNRHQGESQCKLLVEAHNVMCPSNLSFYT